jgi:hypothetical protein
MALPNQPGTSPTCVEAAFGNILPERKDGFRERLKLGVADLQMGVISIPAIRKCTARASKRIYKIFREPGLQIVEGCSLAVFVDVDHQSPGIEMGEIVGAP